MTPTAQALDSGIHSVRGHKVMLDADLADLYGVPTKALVQAVKRNPTRFPPDFMFSLTEQEAAHLRSQIVTSSLSSRNWGGRRTEPYCFTEQGVAMLSSVLKSDRAVQVNVEIMRAFVRPRRNAESVSCKASERRYHHGVAHDHAAQRSGYNPGMAQALEVIEIETGPAPQAAVIWLHGLGADGHDFEPIVPELGLPASMPVRFIFPNAPQRPVTVNMGMRMRAWYDILQLGGGAEDKAGIRESQGSLDALISREAGRGIPGSKIVLAGFSQGGAIALQTALRHPQRLAGVMALSTYLPLAKTLAQERTAANGDLPVFMAHGQFDNMIGMDRAMRSRDALRALGYPVEWRDYPMAHSVCPEEIADIAAFLQRIL